MEKRKAEFAVPIVSPKRQVTIPAEEARRSGLRPGDRVVVRTVRPGLIEIERLADVLDSFAGLFDGGEDEQAELRKLRDEWDV
jgi:AbrB family looped-hinge helix DNA binding protein